MIQLNAAAVFGRPVMIQIKDRRQLPNNTVSQVLAPMQSSLPPVTVLIIRACISIDRLFAVLRADEPSILVWVVTVFAVCSAFAGVASAHGRAPVGYML